MTTALRVTRAYKRFGATQALNGAEFALERGQLLLLLGPNGAGKTTLVRSVAGRVRLDQGEIELLGRKLNGATGDVRRSLGIVPQEIALYPLLTARENLEVFGSFHGMTGAELAAQVTSALQWTGLADRAGERVSGFSGGMKRRLNIACGILHKPEVVLLDEPTVGVDPQSRERIWEMLDGMKQAGTSLVLTTHQLDEAQTRGDRIVIIDHGKTIAAGTFAELVEQTVGPRRQVTLTLDRPLDQPLDGLAAEAVGSAVRVQVAEVAAELPPLLERVRAAGRRVEDVGVQSPTLQHVFLHLTGQELRE
ncbi:MAG: ABC transporter ATP-binding protein [Gemmataceae bacterium]